MTLTTRFQPRHLLKTSTLALALALSAGSAWAQEDGGAGDPLPTCDAADNSYYIMEWLDDGKKASITEIKLGDYSNAPDNSNEIWSGPAKATVAAGMADDGYIYGISGRHVGKGNNLIKYGSSGAQDMGPITYGAPGLGGTEGEEIAAKFGISKRGTNFNAAAFATAGPYKGHLIAGALYATKDHFDDDTTVLLETLLVIDVQNATLVHVIELDPNQAIPQTTGDFAISADGNTLYAGSYNTPNWTWWALDLNSRTLISDSLASGAVGSYNGAARLPNGDYAFDHKGTVDIFKSDGSTVTTGLTYTSNGGSQDATICKVTPAPVAAPTPVPTLGQWGLMLLGLSLGAVTWLRRKRL